MFTAKLNLPLPHPPVQLIKHANAIARMEDGALLRLVIDYGSEKGQFFSKFASKSTTEWIVNNIGNNTFQEDKILISVQIIKGGNFPPHIDSSQRHFNLMYLIHSGGEKVMTHFFKTTPELVKKVICTPDNRLPEDQTELIETFEFPTNSWVLMNTQCFHSVEGVTNKRVGISITLLDSELPKFLKDLI